MGEAQEAVEEELTVQLCAAQGAAEGSRTTGYSVQKRFWPLGLLLMLPQPRSNAKKLPVQEGAGVVSIAPEE